ncbi:MAG TPA: hypothetical protein PLR25_29355 [Planctomycetaceae bacterium]|nr:hypothetical protein [Planctomycetaceae bacterium]
MDAILSPQSKEEGPKFADKKIWNRTGSPATPMFLSNHIFVIIAFFLAAAAARILARLVRQFGISRVNLMFDCEDIGTEGAKDTLSFFAERQIAVRRMVYRNSRPPTQRKAARIRESISY